MDPTIEALTIHPAAWAALIEGLAEGVAYGAAVVASVLVVVVALGACFGGRQRAEDALDEAAKPALAIAVATRAHQIDGARRPRRVCQRTTRQWSVIASHR